MVDANQGWSLEQAQRQARALRAASARLDRGAAARRPAGSRMGGARRLDADAARRRREPARSRCLRRGDRGAPLCHGPARHREVGRHLRLLAGDRQGARGRACATARTTSAAGIGLAASAHLLAAVGGDGIARGRCQPEPAAQRALPGPRSGGRRLRSARQRAGDRHRGRPGAAARALQLIGQAGCRARPGFRARVPLQPVELRRVQVVLAARRLFDIAIFRCLRAASTSPSCQSATPSQKWNSW